MTDKTICPVCRKVVGSWHKSGVHPKCEGKLPQNLAKHTPPPRRLTPVIGRVVTPLVPPPATFIRPVGQGMTQPQRDAILRAINGPGRQRS